MVILTFWKANIVKNCRHFGTKNTCPRHFWIQFVNNLLEKKYFYAKHVMKRLMDFKISIYFVNQELKMSKLLLSGNYFLFLVLIVLRVRPYVLKLAWKCSSIFFVPWWQSGVKRCQQCCGLNLQYSLSLTRCNCPRGCLCLVSPTPYQI